MNYSGSLRKMNNNKMVIGAILNQCCWQIYLCDSLEIRLLIGGVQEANSRNKTETFINNSCEYILNQKLFTYLNSIGQSFWLKIRGMGVKKIKTALYIKVI